MSARPGRVARLVLSATALSLTSCPNQAETLSLLARAAAHPQRSRANRNVRRLIRDTASRAEHLTGPQIPSPPYVDRRPGAEPVSSPGDSIATSLNSVDAIDPDFVNSSANPPLLPAGTDGPRPLRPSSEDPRAPSPPKLSSGLTTPDSAPLFRLPTRVQDANPTAVSFVYSIGRETQIYAEPRFDARRLGYLRFGSELRRTTAAVSTRNCSGGWYGVQPVGFVCANDRTATTDARHPLLQVRIPRPDRMKALPYAYAIARRGAPRLFSYAPENPERPAAALSRRLVSSLGQLRSETMPSWWRKPHEIFGFRRAKDSATIGNGLSGGGVALLGFYVDANTLYGVTPNLELVTTDALDAVKSSSFSGKAFNEDEGLPVAFAMSDRVQLYAGDPRQGKAEPVRLLARREIVMLDANYSASRTADWLPTRDGQWLRTSGLRIIDARTEWPDWARAGETWVDVSIHLQVLIAYEGTRATYATLVSTGVDGLLDPATTKSTKLGTFHIVAKHLTATMKGDTPEDSYEMREVPWVQYFSEGYALHGAYWHDGFGQPRSHGCINLSPIDARWLFHFTSPGLAQNWHGAFPVGKSATVFVHP